VRFKDRTIRMYTMADGLPSNFTTAVLSSHDGTLWVGSYCDGLLALDGQRFKTYNRKGRAVELLRVGASPKTATTTSGLEPGVGTLPLSGCRFHSYSTPEG